MEPLSPGQRAEKLGLSSNRFHQRRMGDTAYDKIASIKEKHRPEIKVFVLVV